MTVQLKAQVNLQGGQLKCKIQGVPCGFIVLFEKLVTFQGI